MAISPTARSHAPDSLTTTIVEKVADREGVAATELRPPLYEIINPDALDEIFNARDGGRVEFTYCGYDIVARSDGEVRVDGDGRDAETPE